MCLEPDRSHAIDLCALLYIVLDLRSVVQYNFTYVSLVWLAFIFNNPEIHDQINVI